MRVLEKYLEKALENPYKVEEKRSVAKFIGAKYMNYKYGDPSTAAIYLSNVLDQMEKAVLQARKVAGDAMWPAIIKEFDKDIRTIMLKGK